MFDVSGLLEYGWCLNGFVPPVKQRKKFIDFFSFFVQVNSSFTKNRYKFSIRMSTKLPFIDTININQSRVIQIMVTNIE